MKNGEQINLTISLEHAAKYQVSVDWTIADGAVTGTLNDAKSGTITFNVGEQEKTVTIKSIKTEDRYNGIRCFTIQFSNPVNALVNEDKEAVSTTVYVSNSHSYELATNSIIYNYAPFLTGVNKNTSESTFQNLDKTLTEYISDYDGEVFRNYGSPSIHFGYGFDTTKSDFMTSYMKGASLNTFVSRETDNRESNFYFFENSGSTLTNTSNFTINYPYVNALVPLIQDGIIDTLQTDAAVYSYIDSDSAPKPAGYVEIDDTKLLDLHVLKINNYGNPLPLYLSYFKRIPLKKSNHLKMDFYFSLGTKEEYNKLSVDQRKKTIYATLKNSLLIDANKPSIVSITAPNATFKYGQLVPITVEFSEPVYGKDLSITANGTKLCAIDSADGHYSSKQTFLYPVKVVDNTNIEITYLYYAKDLNNQILYSDAKQRVMPNTKLSSVSFLIHFPHHQVLPSINLNMMPNQIPQKLIQKSL